MVMNSAGLIAPPVRGMSQAFTWLLIGSFGKELFVLVLELMRVIPPWGRTRGCSGATLGLPGISRDDRVLRFHGVL